MFAAHPGRLGATPRGPARPLGRLFSLQGSGRGDGWEQGRGSRGGGPVAEMGREMGRRQQGLEVVPARQLRLGLGVGMGGRRRGAPSLVLSPPGEKEAPGVRGGHSSHLRGGPRRDSERVRGGADRGVLLEAGGGHAERRAWGHRPWGSPGPSCAEGGQWRTVGGALGACEPEQLRGPVFSWGGCRGGSSSSSPNPSPGCTQHICPLVSSRLPLQPRSRVSPSHTPGPFLVQQPPGLSFLAVGSSDTPSRLSLPGVPCPISMSSALPIAAGLSGLQGSCDLSIASLGRFLGPRMGLDPGPSALPAPDLTPCGLEVMTELRGHVPCCLPRCSPRGWGPSALPSPRPPARTWLLGTQKCLMNE